jgi:NAD-dependent deacetylase
MGLLGDRPAVAGETSCSLSLFQVIVKGRYPGRMEGLEEARRWLAAARRVVVLTGAGISTDSGLRDFRGPDGLWTKDPAAEKASHISHYVADPAMRQRAWRARVEATQTLEPNAGHRALVDLERSGRLHTLITQNVDGLHQRAGSEPALVVEVHGTVRDVQCLDCGDRAPMATALERVRAGEPDPPCQRCGGILKSATISFGQSLVPADLERADAAARACDLLLAIGSTLAVFPIADVVPLAIAHGARVVIVNGSPTAMDDLADLVLTGSISEVLPSLVEGLPPIG